MNDRRELFGWYVYDWANSAFYTTVIAVFLGPYLTEIAKAAADADGFVYPLGIRVAAGSLYSYTVFLSVFLQMIFLPLLGAIADYSNLKKHLLVIFAYTGSLATMGLYFLEGGRYLLGSVLFLVANFSVGASIVFYNAFLNEIASPARRDAVSSNGYAAGYIGGALLLAANLYLFSNAESFGLTTGAAVRISLLSSGVWWGVFTLVPIALLKRRGAVKTVPEGETRITVGFKQLKHTLKQLPRYPHTLLFLAAYLLYNDGIQTVIALASTFGQEELGLEISTLTTVILMVQFIAILGATVFKYIAAAISTKRAIILAVVVWTATIVYAYGALRTARDFYIMGAVIGVVMGGAQALSRSLYSLMIPAGKESEFFSLYEISDKGTSWLGPLIFGLTYQFTLSYRLAILSIAVFFVAGLVLLLFVNVRKAVAEAGSGVGDGLT
jgi:UMF1 family MFS transporter